VKDLYVRFHKWTKPHLSNQEPDLFYWVLGTGFVTIFVLKVCLLDAYRKLRAAVVERIESDREGR
jgi:hypothetical protein